LGSGTGRNGNYFASLGARVSGLELSPTAVALAVQRARHIENEAEYSIGDMGKPFPYPVDHFDIAIDITSSNSLNEAERTNYLRELNRVLKPGAYFFLKALCKEGDKNAKFLLEHHPGREADTYVNQDLGLVERVFTEKDLRDYYGTVFSILELSRKTSYTRFKGQSYKRNFWLAYMQKK
jgi:SAM-dependent methyltransferase